jgi:hypothetical protein
MIGSPVVSKAVVHLDRDKYHGKTFTVVAVDNGPKNIYIQSASLNGKPLTKAWLTHDQITAGGTLRLVMGPNPNREWGGAPEVFPLATMPAGFQYPELPAAASDKPVALALPIRVICGSDEPAGGFVPDPNMVDGAINSSQVTIDTSAQNAAVAAVYQSERYGQDFAYRFPVPKNGRYHVRLHFAEIFDEGAGRRIQNIELNGKPVLTNLDIFAVAGGLNKALVKDFEGIVPDAQGNIVIRISTPATSPDRNAKISGIEILPENS